MWNWWNCPFMNGSPVNIKSKFLWLRRRLSKHALNSFRRYQPVLKNYPTRYIHEPWTAPLQVQRAAKCIIGVDYPKPMVNHVVVSKINQERMKQVYQQLSTYRNVKTPGKRKLKLSADDVRISNLWLFLCLANLSYQIPQGALLAVKCCSWILH